MRTIDKTLFSAFGMPYFKLTRDVTILDRARYMRHYVDRLAKPNLSILDVGCGSAASLMLLNRDPRPSASYIGIDRETIVGHKSFSNSGIKHEFRAVDLDTAWDIGKFDLVICFEVIEHLIEDARLFRRLCTQVAPNGRLLLTTPSSPFVRRMDRFMPGFASTTPVQNGDHVRIGYDVAELQAMAADNNMVIESVDWLSRFEPEELRSAAFMTGFVPRIRQNLRYRRPAPEDAFVIGGDPAVNAERYWSVGILVRHKDAPPLSGPTRM